MSARFLAAVLLGFGIFMMPLVLVGQGSHTCGENECLDCECVLDEEGVPHALKFKECDGDRCEYEEPTPPCKLCPPE